MKRIQISMTLPRAIAHFTLCGLAIGTSLAAEFVWPENEPLYWLSLIFFLAFLLNLVQSQMKKTDETYKDGPM